MKLLKNLTLFFIFSACSHKPSQQISTSDKLGLDTTTDMYYVESEDLTMNKVIDKAKKTIGEFDQALKSNNSRYTEFAVKKRYNTSDGGGEHMWIAGLSIINGNYKGFVNNDAENTTEVKYGDTVLVLRDEITDWMYLDSNTLRGGYTIRAIRDKMNKVERIKLEKDLGFRIED